MGKKCNSTDSVGTSLFLYRAREPSDMENPAKTGRLTKLPTPQNREKLPKGGPWGLQAGKPRKVQKSVPGFLTISLTFECLTRFRLFLTPFDYSGLEVFWDVWQKYQAWGGPGQLWRVGGMATLEICKKRAYAKG